MTYRTTNETGSASLVKGSPASFDEVALGEKIPTGRFLELKQDLAPRASAPAPATQPFLAFLTGRSGLICAFWIAAYLFTCGVTVADPDLWGHTLYGLRCLEQNVWVEPHDPFSYTAPGHRWINHEWLTEYQMGWLWRTCGNLGLWMYRNAALLVVFLVAADALRRSRANLGAHVVLLGFGALTLCEFVAFIRPQLATFALFAMTLHILRLQWDQPRLRVVWALPILMMIWVNAHGGFLAGLGVMGVYAAGWFVRGWQRPEDRGGAKILGTVFLLACLSTVVNPYGMVMHSMLWDHLVPKQMVREWVPLWSARQALGFYVPFVLQGLALTQWRKLRPIDGVLLAVVNWQAVSHIRHIALLLITLLIVLPGPLSAALQQIFGHFSSLLSGTEPVHGRRRLLAVLSAACLLLCLQWHDSRNMWREGIAPWDIAVEARRDVPGVPVRAVTFMRNAGLEGNLVTDYGWGQYVLWHLYPSSKVAFDGRYRTVYPDHIEREYLEFLRTDTTWPSQTPLLDNYPTEIVLLPIRRGACDYLKQRADWVLLYSDAQCCLFIKDIPRFASILEKSRQGQLTAPVFDPWEIFPGGPSDGRQAIKM